MTEEQGPGAAISSVRIFLLLGGAAIWLVLAGVVGAIYVSGTDASSTRGDDATGVDGFEGTLNPGDGATTAIDPDTGEVTTIDPDTGAPITAADPGSEATGAPNAAAGSGGTGSSGGGGGGSGGSGGSGGAAPTPPAVKGDRTGISATQIKVGIHAPKTIGGAPLNLAEDPIKGIEAYVKFINDSGGIHGRKIVLDIQDDRYETSGGKAAGIALIENGNFIISGTLGVDQINAVAIEANKAGVPYHAAGGHEPDFARLKLYQIGTSYDTHVIQLARWMAKDPTLKGKKVGISVLDSPLLVPVADVFKVEAKRVGVTVVETVKIRKPTEQSSYSAQIQKLKDAGTEVFIPMQDPISTSRMVQECTTALCGWTYTFSNFAHEGDVALTLFGGRWGDLKVRGLAAACYYQHANAYNPKHCARMDKAHEQWVAVYDEADWVKDGQGGASGYQIVQMLAEALRRTGNDPTRQQYRAAITSYDRFDDLITSPITFVGRRSYAHGSDQMVVYEAQSNNTYRQLYDGLQGF